MITLFLALLLASVFCQKSEAKPPMVILSGFFGNALDARLNHSVEPHFWCYHNSEWYWIWMNIVDLVPWLTTECLLYNIQIHFDNETQTYSNNKGVEIRGHDFGGTEGIEYVNKYLKKAAQVFWQFVVYFVDNHGYERGKSIRGATYDWRLGPRGLEKSGGFDQIKGLIEDTYNINGNAKVSLVAMSEGCPMITYFLTQLVDDEWKEKYILNLISISGTYDGTREVLPIAIKGKGLGIPFNVNPWGESWGGLPFGLPNQLDLDKPVILTKEKNYTYSLEDLKELYDILGWAEGWEVLKYEMYNPTVDRTVPPGVPTYCFRGSGVKTPFSVSFKKLKNKENYDVVEYDEDGDGICNKNSLLICEEWDGKQEEEVKSWEFKGVGHRELAYNTDAMKIIEKILGFN